MHRGWSCTTYAIISQLSPTLNRRGKPTSCESTCTRHRRKKTTNGAALSQVRNSHLPSRVSVLTIAATTLTGASEPAAGGGSVNDSLNGGDTCSGVRASPDSSANLNAAPGNA